ncbi:MAG: hypothetical protein AB7E79_05725 [Rhodospirillaceae bacterium]
MTDERQAVIKATVARLNGMIELWNANDAAIKHHQAEITRLQEAQRVLEDRASKCRVTGELFDFDIKEELSRFQALSAERAPTSIPATAAAPATVEEFIEAKLREAHPQTLRALDLQQGYESVVRKIHPKTVGMLLYRLSKKGAVRRVGRADWVFVPEGERISEKQNADHEVGAAAE